MIGVTKLLCGSENFGDRLRYARTVKSQINGDSEGFGPVVVWNCTRTCNLKCIHCYADSDYKKYEGELSTDEALNFIDELGKFNVPVLLFSGGEPLMRSDFFLLAEYVQKRGIRLTLSTNGILIDRTVARQLKNIGVSYVGVSLDGIGSNNDKFRGQKGAFDKALKGIRNCLEIGQRVGLRFTINRHNYDQIEDIFKLIEEENIPRVCFYHLVYSGRGSKMIKEDITHEESRAVMDLIMRKTLEFHRKGLSKEILTVDNHADVVYLYLRAKELCPERVDKIWKLMQINGGNRSGIAFGNVDYQGNVHPDQFTQQYTLGNVRDRKFGDIWKDTSNKIMAGLKNRKPLLNGRCGRCKWLSVCNGNFRARAEAITGDFWGSDPACYLTNEEIGVPKEVGLT